MLTSTRRSISYPNTDRSDRPDIPAHILNLVTALELDVIFAQGTNAARLARSHLSGVLFYATDTGIFWWDTGAAWIAWQGGEIDYKQITSSPAAITATTEGTAPIQITGNTVTFDGTRVRVRVFVPAFGMAGGGILTFVIYRDTTVVGHAEIAQTGGGTPSAVLIDTFDTPSAATHFYEVRAYITTATSFTLKAGTGGAGNYLPAWLQVSKA